MRDWKTTHGLSRSREYPIWGAMKQRCGNPKNPRYADYGGRGITVCERWSGKRGFAHFIADMGPRPPGTELDRINNDRGYEPGNCKWVLRSVAGSNKRRNPYKLSLADVAEIRDMLSKGFNQIVIAQRFKITQQTVSRIGSGQRHKPKIEREG